MSESTQTFPFLKDSRIENESLDLLKLYGQKNGKRVKAPVPVFDIIEYLGYDVDFRRDGIYKDMNYLGGLHMAKNLVEINENLSSQEGRMNFTAAHETGHIVLHVPMYSENNEEDESNIICRVDAGLNGDKKELIEVQADKFAAFLLMPTEEVKIAFYSLRNRPLYLKRNIIFDFFRKRSLRMSAINFSRKVIKAGNFTNVSKLAMVNRLIGLELMRGLRYQKTKPGITK